ncbi:MAG: glycosyltransferase family 2 protein [Armatimonadota bacterium]|nr:glycosyltransferase family 2 protein [Armatimonadota bacterium]MDR7412025.1 glycosyltransferase family 2 protein [Armatimonadota bacterium]
MTRITVVVPAYNAAGVLGNCLQHLAEQDYPKELYEVVVVDDGSTDGTRQVVQDCARRLDLPLRYVRQDNSGLAAARNAGARLASYPVVLFLDPDMWAQPQLLRAHARHYDGGRVAVQGTRLLHPAAKVTPFMETKELLPDLTRRRRVGLSPYHTVMSNFSLRAEDLWSVGGFDEAFRGYGWEDIEMGFRLHRAGVELRWEPAAFAWHHHVESLEERLRKQREAGTNAVYFWRKHGKDARLGLFLEIHPALLPLKWLVYRTGILAGPMRALARAAERRVTGSGGLRRRWWLLLASEGYNFLVHEAYYEGVWRALRAPSPMESPSPARARNVGRG